MSHALQVMPHPDWASDTVVTVAKGVPADGSIWARAIFDARTAPAWVRALFGLRQAAVRLVGIPQGDGSVFDINAVVDGEAIIDTDHVHLRFVCGVRVEDDRVHVMTAVRLKGWRGRLYFVPVRFLHDAVTRAMVERAGARLGPSPLGMLVTAAAADRPMPVIGRLHHVALDCRDPEAGAEFWSHVLGWPVTHRSADWWVVAADTTSSGMAFQLAPDHQPPQWPDPDHPQQVHFDVMVDDVARATPRVLALGATMLPGDGTVFADPAGHPFCLVHRPDWAPPVDPSGG